MGVTLHTFTALLFSVALLLLANGLFGSLLSVRMNQEGFSTGLAGLVGAAYFAGLVLGSIAAHKLVERVGHIRTFAALASLISAFAVMHAIIVEPVFWAGLRFLSGMCMAGVFVVTESWLNGAATNQNRGQVLSAYLITTYTALGLGQLLLNVYDPASFVLFSLTSILFSLSLLPLLLDRNATPAPVQPTRFSFKALYRISPLGMIGCFASGVLTGAFYGLGPIFGAGMGMSVAAISAFMSATILGGLVLQWPIGRLSDRYDRRTVLVAVLFVTALASLGVVLAVDLPWEAFLLLAAIQGGASFVIYPLSVAHTNDHIDSADLVQASAGLLIAYGVGASFGPLWSAQVMERVGPAGLYYTATVTALLVAAFGLYRMGKRQGPTAEEQGPFVPLTRMTPIAAELDPRGEAGES
ncbi:MFS transporter [Oceanibaculum pacificum]|uniref:MFS transporter n=1 Tax=Oceanibaculum pacificum TaxID=580166 RepID=A0A154W0Y5_9PROT|nr:MFS transporter [Oceanibaculum pacificum]KZD07282.1 MFS transporter [Oceanibaculum pacificum]